MVEEDLGKSAPPVNRMGPVWRCAELSGMVSSNSENWEGIMRRLALTIFAAIAAIVSTAGPAAAQTCTMPPAAAEMDDRYTGVLDCTHVEYFTIDTPGGPRQVRIVRDAEMPDFWTEPLEDVKRGIRRSAAAMSAVSGVEVGDLTVIVSGLLPDPDSVSREWLRGVASWPAADGNCAMIVYPANTGRESLEFTTAHEFFHCIQNRTAWNQMDSEQPNRWWVEATAEWYANLVYPGTGNSDGFVASFDAASSSVSLTGMSDGGAYGNTAFFSWYTESHGAGVIAPFMRAMPISGGASSESAALAGKLPADEALKFVEAYLDTEIRQPGGRTIPLNPRLGRPYLFLEDRRLDLEADRFVTYRTELVFTCGTWNIGLSGEQGRWAVKEEGESWRRLPTTFKVEPDDEKRYKVAAMGVGEAGFSATIDARWTDPDGECNCRPTPPEDVTLDSCIVGVWELESGGGAEWMHKAMKKAFQDSGTSGRYESNMTSRGRRIQFTDRGLYVFGKGVANAPARTESITKKYDTISSRWEGTASSIGTWSASDDTLSACPISYISSGKYEVSGSRGGSITMRGNYFSDHIHAGGYAYTCSETTLDLRFLTRGGFGAGLPPITWEYRRVNPAAAE